MLEPGETWLVRQFRLAREKVNAWPAWLRQAAGVEAAAPEHLESNLDPPMSFADLVAAQRGFLAGLPDDFVDADLD